MEEYKVTNIRKLSFSKDIPILDEADIVIIGGGPSGIAGAIYASKLGKKVYLIEATGALGGLGTSGLVPGFAPMSDGFNFLADGVAREIINRLRKYNYANFNYDDLTGWIPYNPEYLKLVYDELILENKINVRFFTKLIDVVVEEGEIKYVILSGNSNIYALKGKIFLDCTGDAVLSYLAGVPCEVGDENRNTQAPTLCSIFANVDWERYRNFLKETEQGGNLNKTLEKAIKDGVFTIPDFHMSGAFLNGKTIAGMNVGHIYGIDCLDDIQITNAMIAGRRLIQEFLYFYKTYVPGFEDAELVATSLILGVRETRRIRGKYILTVEDFLARRHFPDEIGRYNYPIDIHRSTPSIEDFKAFEEEFFKLYRYEKGESYGIPYRSIIPQNVKNLLVAGRCISTDRKMQGSIRVMPCCFITGQSAGAAASLCIDNKVYPEELDAKILRGTLRDLGAYIP